MDSIIKRYLDKTYNLYSYESEMVNKHTGETKYYNGIIHDVDILFSIDIWETRRIVDEWWKQKHMEVIARLNKTITIF